jgi:manganese-dependent inorganic pyrophosphatase
MRTDFPVASDDEPVREVGLTMAREGLDLVPIVDGDGALTGVMTERALARRYIRESLRATSRSSATARTRSGAPSSWASRCW